MEQNTNYQNTNVTKYKCNKIQIKQNAKILKYKHDKIQKDNIPMQQNTNATKHKWNKVQIYFRLYSSACIV